MSRAELSALISSQQTGHTGRENYGLERPESLYQSSPPKESAS
jgi:hypothetical protein